MHWHAFMSPPVGGFFLVFPLPWKFDSYFSEGGGGGLSARVSTSEN